MKQTTLDYQKNGSDRLDLKPIKKDELEYFKEINWIRRKQNCEIIYSQDWPAYNKAKTNELRMFQDFLIEIIDSLIETNTPLRQGRPFNDFKEMIFCCVMRAYYKRSCRECASHLDYALSKGYINKIPSFNSIYNYYKDVSITPILKYLIEKSGSPLKEVETVFTCDSSGFSTSLFGRWLDIRIQSEGLKRVWKKAHIFSGVKTNIITAIEVTPGYYADSPQLKGLAKITFKTFKMQEVSADKAYSSRNNLQVITELGAIPFIPFREDATGRSRGTMIWGIMKRFYDNHREYFMDHYHKRSNAETVFSMMKRKLGNHLYSRSEVGQVNEILCKALAHNICVLIQEYFEQDIPIKYNYCAKMKVDR